MPDLPGLPPQPTLPDHLKAMVPPGIVNFRATPQQAAYMVERIIDVTLRDPRLRLTVNVDKDEAGWTIRIDLPKLEIPPDAFTVGPGDGAA